MKQHVTHLATLTMARGSKEISQENRDLNRESQRSAQAKDTK